MSPDRNTLPQEIWDVRAKGMSGLEYRWGGSHTVNIFSDGEEIDVFTFYDTDETYETVDSFLAAVTRHEKADAEMGREAADLS